MKYYLLFETCFSTLLEYLLFEKKTDFWLSSIWKGVWLTIPWSKKLKNPWFFQVFHWPPPRWRRFQSSSGRVPSRELLWHRRRRVVTRVRASMFYWFYIICLEKQQKMAVGQKKTNRRYCTDHPQVEGFILRFLVIWATLEPSNIFYLKWLLSHPRKASSIIKNSRISSITVVWTIYIWLYMLLLYIIYTNIYALHSRMNKYMCVCTYTYTYIHIHM